VVTLADSLLSSTARKLALRKRPDLTARQHRYQGRAYWVVKEPVGLNYFRFQEEEFFILQLLDGNVSLDDLKQAFEAAFPPQKISVEELQQFLGLLHKSGLVIADVPGQGRQLKLRRDERVRKEWTARFTNLLAIRFKGIDPEAILNWLHPKLAWMYTPPAVACCLLLMLSAILLVLVQFDEFRSRLPTFHQFFTLQNAIWLSIALAATKVLHEFGHGLTCKHFGGECHEMGVMILVLTPCLYCNVSDSWMLPNKWHRAYIGAAGMYVELIIASICTWIWWYSDPHTLLNQLCLSTMFVCSVSTVIFNSNPLLRYDGYYILSDLIEIPNLRQKATDILARKLSDWCLGLELPDDPFLPQRNQFFFALYSVAAAIYRWVVVFSIIWFLYRIWQPYRLEVIGQTMALVALYGLFLHPLYKMYKFLSVPGRLDRVKKARLFGTIGVVAVLAAAVCLVPLPNRVFCPLEVEARDAQSVYVGMPGGTLEKVYVQPGQRVRPGKVLAQLVNLDLDLQITTLEGELAHYEAERASLLNARYDSPSAGLRLQTVERAIESTRKLLRQRQEDKKRLRLVAQQAGAVLPPPEVPQKPAAEGELPHWYGTPLDPRNLGCYLEEGQLFCLVGDPTRLQAILIIPQEEVEFVSVGQRVSLRLDDLPGQEFPGVIEEISQIDLKVTPRHSSNKAQGEVPSKTDESGVERPLNISFQAKVYLDNPDGLVRLGFRGKAKIYARWQTLGQRAWRFVNRTFHFLL